MVIPLILHVVNFLIILIIPAIQIILMMTRMVILHWRRLCVSQKRRNMMWQPNPLCRHINHSSARWWEYDDDMVRLWWWYDEIMMMMWWKDDDHHQNIVMTWTDTRTAISTLHFWQVKMMMIWWEYDGNMTRVKWWWYNMRFLPLYIVRVDLEKICSLRENKLASLETTLVQNYDPPTHLITDGGEL